MGTHSCCNVVNAGIAPKTANAAAAEDTAAGAAAAGPTPFVSGRARKKAVRHKCTADTQQQRPAAATTSTAVDEERLKVGAML